MRLWQPILVIVEYLHQPAAAATRCEERQMCHVETSTLLSRPELHGSRTIHMTVVQARMVVVTLITQSLYLICVISTFATCLVLLYEKSHKTISNGT